jgi:hypothetical protein
VFAGPSERIVAGEGTTGWSLAAAGRYALELPLPNVTAAAVRGAGHTHSVDAAPLRLLHPPARPDALRSCHEMAPRRLGVLPCPSSMTLGVKVGVGIDGMRQRLRADAVISRSRRSLADARPIEAGSVSSLDLSS